MAQYRSTLPNFYSDKGGSYVSIGAIVPVLVDENSDPTNGQATYDPHYSHRGYLYCDGGQYEIRNYPHLYEIVGNDYLTGNELFRANSLYFSSHGAPGTIFRTFVDSGNVYAEVYGRQITLYDGSNSYDRVIPNGATITFDNLGDFPDAGGQVVEDEAYRLSYTEAAQSLASRADTHVYRILINYDESAGTGGNPGATIAWTISSSSLVQGADTLPFLSTVYYGTVPAIDPGTYDPLTGTGYPTGYTQYPNADNDTIAINWANMSNLPQGVTVDTYEVYLEDLSVETFVHWRITNIAPTKTGLLVNEALPTGATLFQNNVEQTSLGSSPDWVNNGYSGPQPPSGEKHKFRLNVIANLSNSQTLITHLDFTAGDGGLVPDYGSPTYTDNYDIIGDGSGIVDTSLNVSMSGLATHPDIRIRKSYDIKDYPYILGNFRLPDYRDRKLIGYGEGVEGPGTPLVEDRITMEVGDSGGIWYIPTSTLEDPIEFYEISDVLTTGYTDVQTQIQPYLTGEKKYTVGPMEDYIFARPAEHNHEVLGSFVNEFSPVSFGGVDTYTTGYNTVNGAVENFIPGGSAGDGTPLGHSHGLLGNRPTNSVIASFGNTEGIGERFIPGSDGCYVYRVTEAPSVEIASISSDGTTATITTVNDHGFSIGDAIIVQGAGAYDGAFVVIADGYNANTVKVQPDGGIAAGSGGAGAFVREAAGYFEERTSLPTPRVYVVNNSTIIGGKEVKASEADLGNEVFSQTINSGTLNIASNVGGSSNITGYSVIMQAPGGGGADATGNGGNGGSAVLTLTVDGVTHTITVTGGNGGSSGNGGGGAGSGGTVTIPTALINDERFDFFTNETGSTGITGPNGGDGGGSGNPGAGGDGAGGTSITTGTQNSSNFTSSGSFNTSTILPSNSVVNYTSIDISGGAGGDGPNQGQAGCSTTGGSGSNGRRLTGRYEGGGTFTYQVGTEGGRGANIHAGSTSEARTNSVGTGAASGGAGGRGAWGNGGSGGAGGGATGVQIGGGYIMGAGGGGGGGGNGGGNNGGSVTDPCWTGGAGLGPASGTYSSSSIGFTGGGSGGESGCTAGGGGGGGGGAGPQGGGNGGVGGVAGAGHVNTGSGSGGRAGRSAYNSTVINNVSESSGSSGGGYVKFTIGYTQTIILPTGGGGGRGGLLEFNYSGDDIATAISASLGTGGNGGGTLGDAGSAGDITVTVYETIEGDENVIDITSPNGVYYEVPNYPTSLAFPSTFFTSGAIWHSSSEKVDVEQSVGDNFPLATTLSNGKSNRFILFTGGGNRFLQIGPLNLTNANAVHFGVIKGNNSNGGESPEESLLCYYKTSEESPSETLLQAVAQASVTAAGYVNYTIPIDVDNNARTDGIYLVLRQTRPDSAGDNDDVPGGNTNDNWGLSQVGLTYDEVTQNVFVPSSDSTLPGNEGSCGPDGGINVVRRTVTAGDSNIRFTDGTFRLSSSTPISVTAEARVQTTIPLITRYHRSKYLIKAF